MRAEIEYSSEEVSQIVLKHHESFYHGTAPDSYKWEATNYYGGVKLILVPDESDGKEETDAQTSIGLVG